MKTMFAGQNNPLFGTYRFFASKIHNGCLWGGGQEGGRMIQNQETENLGRWIRALKVGLNVKQHGLCCEALAIC